MFQVCLQNVNLMRVVIFCIFLTSCNSMAKETSDVTVNKTISIQAKKQRVWSALTDSTELAQWWNKGVKLESFVGGEFYEPWGDNQLATGKVLSVDVMKNIRFTWREKNWSEGQLSVCEFSLQEKDGVTVLTMKHSGWESFGDSKHQMAEGFSNGWDFLLPKLKSYVESK